MSGHMNPHPASQRMSMADAFNTDNKYWGARFCDTTKATPWKLLWHTTKGKIKQFTTTIRIFPGKNPDHDVDWDPYRLGPGRDDFGDWIRWHWAWRRAGYGDPVTFLLQPGKDLDRQNPAALLHRHVKYASDNNKGAKAHWAAMVNDKANQGAVIARPKKMFMVQGAIFEHGGTHYDIPKGLGEDDLPILLDIGSDAAKKIRNICREKFKPEELEQLGLGEPASWEGWFKYGDPIGLDAGKFFEIYPEAAPPPHVLNAQRANRPQAPQGPMRLSPAAMRQRNVRDEDDDDDGPGIQGYTVVAHDSTGPDEHMQFSPQLDDYADILDERVRPWREVLIFPSYEEQAKLIAPLLRLHSDSNPQGELFLDVIESAWGDHRAWMPDPSSDLWGEWVQRVSVGGSDIGQSYPPRDRAMTQQNVGPTLNRRPPVQVAPNESYAQPDETMWNRQMSSAAGETQTASPPFDPVSDAPPQRLRPRTITPNAAPAVEQPPQAKEKSQESVAEQFQRLQEEEAALKASGIKPNFPTPGTPDAPASQSASAPWRRRLNDRKPGSAPAPAAESVTAAPTAPSATPPASPPQATADDGGGFTAPPAAPATSSVKDRLAQMRKATQKIPPG